MTTALFWGAELFVGRATDSVPSYLLAPEGLVLGNWTKYHLNKRFIFVRREVIE